jgi:hypothetical protein
MSSPTVALAWTGCLGGQIRHTELGSSMGAATERRGAERDD